MNGAVVILIHKIVDDQITSTIRDENNGNSEVDKQLMQSLTKPCEEILDFKNYDDTNLCLNFAGWFNSHNSIVVEALPNDHHSSSSVSEKSFLRLNFPTLIKCQNCETHFPTKYQYQRHQCDFNLDKVSFKSVAENINDDTVTKENNENQDVYACPICFKIFINKSNLEQHQAGHSNNNNNDKNICEFCDKHFVSENRLRIHKENHCKKAGDVSKFYRSDVTVWKCKKCYEVFSSVQNANHHVPLCQDNAENVNQPFDNNKEQAIEDDPEFNEYFDNDHAYSRSSQCDNNYIETISTEILLQCEFCNRTFSDKNLLLMHQRKHTTAKNYECVNCDKIFDSYTIASSHWVKKCSDFANVFYLPKFCFCEYCDRTFKSHEILYNHKIKKKHYTPKLHIAINSEHNYTNNELLTSSSTITENKDIINKLIQDVLKTLEVPVSSKLDPKNAEDPNKDEISTGITAEIIKTEPESGNSSSASIQLNEQPEEADGVDAQDKSGKKRKWHKSMARSKKLCITTDEGFKYQCERCIKVFNCIDSLESHRSREHVASFCCEECGHTLTSAKALLIHCRAHKSLKPYVCDTCGRSYSQTSHLWQHMRFHQGIKPFACPHQGCEARYTIRPDLKDHIRKVHTRERPFKCNVCNKCFLTGSVYYQHRLIHTNDRRYGCEICNKRFFRADALNNHKRIHTDERPYPCTVCGREFRQKGDRNKHIRTQHTEHFSVHM